MVASILQMVTSVTPARTFMNSGGSLLGSSRPGGRGRRISSSRVASTMPAPRSSPLTTFLPTFARSGSWPVFTGQRSVPGLSASSFAGADNFGAASGPATRPAAALIFAATLRLTTLKVLTSVIGPPSLGGVGGNGPAGTGGAGAGVTGAGPGTTGPGCTIPLAFPDRPNTTKRGVESRLDPSPSPFMV